mmetsp:Transcript_5469/g.15659  ORF Transcript_5469/g.15659 Transcript_5469/m.15659 type:complete len:213 (-) Transcript_5469:1594-2232(-)
MLLLLLCREVCLQLQLVLLSLRPTGLHLHGLHVGSRVAQLGQLGQHAARVRQVRQSPATAAAVWLPRCWRRRHLLVVQRKLSAPQQQVEGLLRRGRLGDHVLPQRHVQQLCQAPSRRWAPALARQRPASRRLAGRLQAACLLRWRHIISPNDLNIDIIVRGSPGGGWTVKSILLVLQLLDTGLRRRDLVAVLAVRLQAVGRHLAFVEVRTWL